MCQNAVKTGENPLSHGVHEFMSPEITLNVGILWLPVYGAVFGAKKAQQTNISGFSEISGFSVYLRSNV